MTKLEPVATRRLSRFGRTGAVSSEPWTFEGLATLTTSRPDLGGPYSRPVRAGLLIDARGGLTVDSLDVEPAQLGSVTCVFSLLPSTGSGRYVAGNLRLELGLRFGIDVLPGADSDISLTLLSDPRAPRTVAGGPVTASGTATFQKGYLGGRLGTLVVSGTITRSAVRAGP